MGRPRSKQEHDSDDLPGGELDIDEDPAELLAGVDLSNRRAVHAAVYQAQTAKYRNRFVRTMAKYARGADLMGLSGWEIDRLLGNAKGRFRQDCNVGERQVTIEPEEIALYQTVIPLSAEYLRAEDAHSTPDDRVLARNAESGRLHAILPELAKIQDEAGVPSEAKFLDLIRDVVSLNDLGRPIEWFWEAAEEKIDREKAALFERIRNRTRTAKGGSDTAE